MFSEQNITKAMSQKELMAFVRDMFEHDLLLDLLCVIKNEDVKTKFPEEHKRLESEWEKIHHVEMYIGEVCARVMEKWFWPVYWNSKTKEERMLAFTKCIKAFHYEMKRYEAVLAKHFDKILKYCEENKIDLNQYKNPPYWRNWKEKD